MASNIVTPPDEYNLTRNPIFVVLDSDNFTGAEAPYTPSQPNLSCYLEVWRDVPGGEEKLAPIQGPYSTNTKQFISNLASLFNDLNVEALPTAQSLGVSPGDPYYGEAEGLVNVFRIKHADQYGDPVAAEALAISGDYLAINGGLPADAIQSVNLAASLIGLHSYYYKRNSAFTFFKPVAAHQPDYLYFVALLSGDIEVTVTRFYDDGTSDFYIALTMPVDANKAYWVQSGFNQLKVEAAAAAGKTVHGYSVSLIRNDQNAFTAFYVIDDECPSWERFLLYHNGFGGFETVRMKGMTQYQQRTSRETFNRVSWIDFDPAVGSIDHLRTNGNSVFRTHTGHYPDYYINHLRQLLHAKLWMIDTDLGAVLNEWRFLRLMCETNQIDVRRDGAGPDGFAIAYTYAWEDDGYNIY